MSGTMASFGGAFFDSPLRLVPIRTIGQMAIDRLMARAEYSPTFAVGADEYASMCEYLRPLCRYGPHAQGDGSLTICVSRGPVRVVIADH